MTSSVASEIGSRSQPTLTGQRLGVDALAQSVPAQQASIRTDLVLFLEYLAARNYSADTIEHRTYVIGAFLGWATLHGICRADDVTRNVLERYRLQLSQHRKKDGEPLAVRTQIVRLVALRAFFRWLAREHKILVNPAADLELPRSEKRLPAAILSLDEVEKIMAMPDVRTALGLRDRAILEMLYATGIRRSELAGLRAFDIDHGRHCIVVRKGKGGKDRIVPTGKRALSWVEAYCDRSRPQLARRAEEGRLFINRRGAGLRRNKLTELISRYIAAARIGKKGSCHMFRHAAATHMLENGADIRFIQELLGHENLDTTQIYTRVSIARLTAVHAATHPSARLEAAPSDYSFAHKEARALGAG